MPLVVCQTHFGGWRDAINRRLYSKFIRQLFLDTRPDIARTIFTIVGFITWEF